MTREPGMLFMVMLFPVIATLAFGFSFGTSGAGQPTLQIGIVNTDSSGSKPWSQYLVRNLSQTEILIVRNYSTSVKAREDLSQGRIQAVLTIPEDFGSSCDSFWASPTDPTLWTNTTITLDLDSGSLFATQAIPPIVQQTLSTIVFGVQPTSISGPIQMRARRLPLATRKAEGFKDLVLKEVKR